MYAANEKWTWPLKLTLYSAVYISLPRWGVDNFNGRIEGFYLYDLSLGKT